MAAAIALGTFCINVSNQPVTPHSTANAEANKNAPTASPIDTPASAVTNSAAPGVDHAVSTGVLCHQARPALVTPMPMPNAHSHEPICAGVAPTALAA